MALQLNFARRPFRDYRPVQYVAGAALLVGAVFFAMNVRLYVDFRKEVEGTRKQIEWLEGRQTRAAATAEEARAALNRYKVSTLAVESRELLRLVRERQFSWIELLHRLERVLPPEVRLARLSPRFDEKGEVTLDLSLVGPSNASVVRTVAAFSRNPAFESVDLRSEASPEMGVPEGYSFQLAIRYRPEGSKDPVDGKAGGP
ncbi:MAG: hypothetical protein H7X85_08645 [Thermoanaerobaculia bacterium]|nr:hypothetical protein [Thermoanaerobaculia bacterium]